MTDPTPLRISPLSAEEAAARIPELAGLLHACVHAGASISFVLPFELTDSAAWWREAVLPTVREGRILLLAAWRGDALAGVVQLCLDTPPNQPHRADVRKLLVHPAFRRRGIGRALMLELERRAAAMGRTLLTLDTRAGDHAEPLYVSLGYAVLGTLPGYCRDTFDPKRLDAATFFYKHLPRSLTPGRLSQSSPP